MEAAGTYFKDFDALDVYLVKEQQGALAIDDRPLEGYAGMGLRILLRFDLPAHTYHLDLEWASFGLDVYVDTLVENYVYAFDTLKELTDYLHAKYQVSVDRIPIHHTIPEGLFPNPIYNGDQKDIFTGAWNRFEQEFRTGIFLDKNLRLISPK